MAIATGHLRASSHGGHHQPPGFCSFSRQNQHDVPRFCGSDPTSWLLNLTEFFLYHQIAVEERISIAGFYMDGPALTWFQWMTRNNQFHSREAFIQQIHSRFSPATTGVHWIDHGPCFVSDSPGFSPPSPLSYYEERRKYVDHQGGYGGREFQHDAASSHIDSVAVSHQHQLQSELHAHIQHLSMLRMKFNGGNDEPQKSNEDESSNADESSDAVQDEHKQGQLEEAEQNSDESRAGDQTTEQRSNEVFPDRAQPELLNETNFQIGVWSTRATELQNEKEKQSSSPSKGEAAGYSWKLYHIVPHTKLAEKTGPQIWVQATGDYLTFPGGGTQFTHGDLHYIDFIPETLSDIAWGQRSRVILDADCKGSFALQASRKEDISNERNVQVLLQGQNKVFDPGRFQDLEDKVLSVRGWYCYGFLTVPKDLRIDHRHHNQPSP